VSYKFNPFTGNLDLVGAGSTPGPNYVGTFNNTSDWSGPALGVYTLTVTVATHAKGLNPMVQVLELVGSDYENILVSFRTNVSGDVTIEVPDTPDNRFNGKIIITENN
jgi:hypothetical protein